ncbi:unnamed protein product, partial [Owenia fusiformis]
GYSLKPIFSYDDCSAKDYSIEVADEIINYNDLETSEWDACASNAGRIISGVGLLQREACRELTTGQFVRIKLSEDSMDDRYLVLCEVKIFGSKKNEVSVVGKPTYPIPTPRSGPDGGVAVDGSIPAVDPCLPSAFESSTTEPYWMKVR